MVYKKLGEEDRSMLIWFCGIIIEVFILGLWYSFIYNKYNRCNKSFILVLIQSIELIWIYIVCKLFPSKGKEELKEFIEKQHILSNFNYFLVFGSALIFPGVVCIFMKNISLWLFAIIGIGMVIETINKYKMQLFLFFENYIKFLTKFQRIKQSIKSKKIKKKDRKNKESSFSSLQKIKIGCKIACILIVGIAYIFLCLFDLVQASDNNSWNNFLFFNTPIVNIFFLFLIVAVGIFVLSDKTLRKKIGKDIYKEIFKLTENENKYKQGIWIDKGFEEIGIKSEEVLRMCREEVIFDVTLCCLEQETKIAVSGYDKKEGAYIIFGKKRIEELKSSLSDEEFCKVMKVLLGHELTHVKYKDYNDKKASIKYSLLSCFFPIIFFALILIIYFITKNYSLCVSLEVLSLIVIILSERIITKRKFWKQVMEFRADRIGLEVSRVDISVFEKFLLRYEKKQEGQDNIFLKMYERYMEEKDHPSIHRRIIEIKRGKWKKTEYLRYLWLVGKRVYSGKGWYL